MLSGVLSKGGACWKPVLGSAQRDGEDMWSQSQEKHTAWGQLVTSLLCDLRRITHPPWASAGDPAQARPHRTAVKTIQRGEISGK